jgi:hypothetical protein
MERRTRPVKPFRRQSAAQSMATLILGDEQGKRSRWGYWCDVQYWYVPPPGHSRWRSAPQAYLAKTRGNTTGTGPVGTPERLNPSRWGCHTPIVRRRHPSPRTLHVFLSLVIPKHECPVSFACMSARDGIKCPRNPQGADTPRAANCRLAEVVLKPASVRVVAHDLLGRCRVP